MGSSAAGGGGYEIGKSCRFYGSTPHFDRGSFSPTSPHTVSVWVKRASINLGRRQIIFAINAADSLEFTSDAYLLWQRRPNTITTTQRFRDTTNWYHILCKSESGAFYLYVNNVLVASNTSSTANPYTAGDIHIGSNSPNGYLNSSTSFDGYMAEFHWVQGTALGPDSFGETGDYGEWKPIEYTGSHGSNGFYLDFATSSSLGTDASGNSNNFTLGSGSMNAHDSGLDSPTNNFCTWHPEHKDAQNNTNNYLEGNLQLGGGGGSSWRETFASFEVPKTGKWYMEFLHLNGYAHIGLLSGPEGLNSGDSVQTGHAWWDYDTQQGSGAINYNNAGQTSGGTGSGLVFAISVNEGVVKFYKSNSVVHTFSQNLSNAGRYPVFPIVQTYSSAEWFANFGQSDLFGGAKSDGANASDANGYGSFYYAPPTDHLALCSKNLPDPTITPSEHFNTVLYTGANGNTVTGVGFQPDLTWIKARNQGYSHNWYDSVRGATQKFNTDNAAAQESNLSNGLTAFGSDGFTVGNHAGHGASGNTFVAWNWKAGGSGSSNTNGAINTTSTSANVSAGFSISKYAGSGNNTATTVGHGLSQAPDLVLSKRIEDVDHGWSVGANEPAASLDFTDTHFLHEGSDQDDAVWWNDTAPTSTVVHLGGNSWNNYSGKNFMLYCFHSVEGYSKIGNYKGNGSTDGTFVYCGFRPQWLLVKPIKYSDGWKLFDIKRGCQNGPYNQFPPGDLKPDTHASENFSTAFNLEFLSNGFKWRGSDNSVNGSSYYYLFYAIAEQPFKFSNAK